MMSRLYLLASTNSSSPSSVIKPLLATPLGFNLIKKCSNHQGGRHNEENIIDKERAQSTAEIMDELEHEKEENLQTLAAKSHQGFVSHTSDKTSEAIQEVVGGDDTDTDTEDIKEKFKKASPGQTYHKPRDDGGIGPASV